VRLELLILETVAEVLAEEQVLAVLAVAVLSMLDIEQHKW
jgi:hypothetical protein